MPFDRICRPSPTQKSSNQELVRLQVYTDPEEAWKTNIYDEDTEAMNGFTRHKVLGPLSESGLRVSPSL